MANAVKQTQAGSASGSASNPTSQLTWTGSYFIWSALNGYSGATSFGLNVQGATATAGTPIILYPWAGGQPNELWQYTANQFVTNLDDSLVIGLGDPVPGSEGNFYLVLVDQNSSDESQVWNVDASTGLITNALYPDLYMNVNGGTLTSNAAIVTNSLQEGNPDEVWALVPAWAATPSGTPSTPVPTWSYIQSALSPYENSEVTPYVLTVEGSGNVDGNGVVLEAVNSNNNSAMQMWQVLSTGPRIISRQGPAYPLTLGPNNSNNVWEVTVNSQPALIPNMQHWDLGWESPNQIDNWHLSEYLVVSGGTSGPVSPYGSPNVVVAPGTSNPSYQWYLMPSNPLDSVMAQAPVPFPAFSGDQLTAYQYINQQLGLGGLDTPDLRGQYLYLGAPLSNWQDDIKSYKPPAGVSEGDWQNVVQQLDSELTYVVAIQNLFSNYTTWHDEQFSDDGSILNGLISDASMQQGTNTTGLALSILQGALYTVLEAIPVVGNVLGNVVNTAITAGLAAQTVSVTPFQVAVSELWSELSQTFDNVKGQTALMETVFLSDWGKLQAVYPLTLLAQGAPGSLSATALADANLLNSSKIGYTIAAMQILMAAQYQIYVYQDDDDDAVDGIPSYAQLVVPAGDDLWTKYWVADSTDWDVAPGSEALQNDLWDNGVATSDFFTGANGWGLATCYVYDYVVTGCNAVVVTITNQTGNLLTATASVSGGTMAQAPATLNTYVSTCFAAQGDETSSTVVTIEIFDPSVSTENAIASFAVTQPTATDEGGWPSVSKQSANNGYSFSSPICNQAAFQGGVKDGYPGAVQITLYHS